MNYKEANEILVGLIGKDSINPQEKDALNVAVGVLAWMQLADSKVKAMKDKKDTLWTKRKKR